jgi:L-threonylcarbamoyladenylate synthase
VTPADLDEAARVILAGGLVAMPTETVYGLAADASNGRAVAAIYAAKGRPDFNPLICHASDLAMAQTMAEFPPLALALAARFWPGPLTLVLPRARTCTVSELATAGLATIAVRIPKNLAATGLIARVGGPLAAPSANPSERLSPTTADHVAAHMGDRIDLMLDGGATPAGLESTIIAPTDEGVFLLRPGALSRSEIESVTGPLKAPEAASGVIAPGMLKRHYAPRARLRLGASDAAPGEAFLGFGAPPSGVTATLNLSPSSDLEEAAANLFAMLHRLDASYSAIAVAMIPNTGLGEAIIDRLERAAATFSKSGVREIR